MTIVHRALHAARSGLARPERSPRLAVVIGRLLGAAFLVCFATGLFSHLHQHPPGWMTFPTRPVWLYQFSQGVHVTAGILCFPLLLAKLHVVYGRLFQTPVVRSLPHLLERASIAVFVSSSLVQITIGLINTYQWYQLFPFSFVPTHYALSYVVIGSLVIHIGVQLPLIARHWRRERMPDSSTPTAPADAHAADAHAVRGVTARLHRWIDTPPLPPTATRRVFLGTVATAAVAVVATTAGQSARALEAINLFAPRHKGVGPQNLPINRTAEQAQVTETAVDEGWVLTVSNGDTERTFTRAQLLALTQHEVELPIACVEGWSQMATWTGPRLADLLASVGAEPARHVRAVSLEQSGSYAVTVVEPEFTRDPLTLVALTLNGTTLDLDHGYPARLISPARPGVLQTKWLSRFEVLA